MVKRRVFVSCPVEAHLTPEQRAVSTAVLDCIKSEGFEPQRFMRTGIPAGMGWNFEAVESVMRRCVGAVILGFPRWTISEEHTQGDYRALSITEYSHYEGAVAHTLGLPLLIFAEEGIADRGMVWTGGGKPILFVPKNAKDAWLTTETFRHRFSIWLDELKVRHDIFLGYCSQAKGTASAIDLYLTKELKAKVLNWVDFSAGGNILDEIEKAASICTAGIFLFTKDDPIETKSGEGAAPRDNVVYEAGYFTHSKGKERVLIIREEGSKMPADIGGNIYLSLTNRENISTIETDLRKFVETRL